MGNKHGNMQMTGPWVKFELHFRLENPHEIDIGFLLTRPSMDD